MELVIRSAVRAFEDLAAPGIPKLFLLCVALTAGAAVIAIGGGVWAYQHLLIPSMPSPDDYGSGFLYDALNVGAWFLFLALLIAPMFLLFWSLMIFIAGFFDEHIAERIEQHRYPTLAIGTNRPFWPEFWQDVRFTIKILLYNIGLIIVPIFWPFWWLLFPLLNGYVLGMYFFRMAGGRHIGREAAGTLAKQHRGKILLAGLGIVFAFTIPLVNLVVPFWGVALMVHLYHLIGKPAPQEVLPAE